MVESCFHFSFIARIPNRIALHHATGCPDPAVVDVYKFVCLSHRIHEALFVQEQFSVHSLVHGHRCRNALRRREPTRV